MVRTREPGGTPMAEQIRQLLLDHDQEDSAGNRRTPALLCVTITSPQQHHHSCAATGQVGGVRSVYRCQPGLPGQRPRAWTLIASNDWPNGSRKGAEPDMTLLLDAPAEIGMERAAARGEGDRMDNEELAFYQRVYGRAI